jgi:hypothetical protein
MEPPFRLLLWAVADAQCKAGKYGFAGLTDVALPS